MLVRLAVARGDDRDEQRDVVLAEANIRFRRPLEFDDEFEVRVSVSTVTARSLTLEFDFTRAGEQIAEVEVSYVCVDSEQHTAQPIPERIRSVLEGE